MLNKIVFPFLEAGAATDAAATENPGMGSLLSTIIMIALLGLMMYFLLYRPQKKQEKAVNEMRGSLKVGDEISTTGGVLGKVLQIKDDFVVIETGNDRTKLKIAKWSIRAIEKRAEDDEEDDED